MPRGGSRPGSGRPKGESNRIKVTVAIAPETKARIEELRKAGFILGRELDAWIAGIQKK